MFFIFLLILSFSYSSNITFKLVQQYYLQIKNINKMEKLVRYRKAFYQKENDLLYCNKKKDLRSNNNLKKFGHQQMFQSLTHSYEYKIVKQQKNKTDSQAYCELYGQDLLHLPAYQSKQPNFLSNHSIDNILRARMIDWMIEVTSSYKFSHKTYFDGISLMDRYFNNEVEVLSPNKLHITGIICMVIASKMNQIYPIKLKTAYQKIAHRKISLDQLSSTENKVMKMLEYKLNSWTLYDLIMLKISMLFCERQDQNSLKDITNKQSLSEAPKSIAKMQELSSYLLKFVIFDYDLYLQNSTLLMAESIVRAVFQICSILPPIDFFSSSPILLELTKQKVFRAVKSYKHKYGGLNNVFKFASREIIQKVDQFLD